MIFLGSWVNDMYDKYYELVNAINQKYGFTSDCGGELISFRENKDSQSFCLGSNALVVLKQTKKVQRIYVKKILFNKVNIDFSEISPSAKLVDIKSDPLYEKIETLLEDDIVDCIYAYIERAIQDYQPPKTFACCSRYIQCSDEKKCLHPQQIYAKQCWYRDNLEKGSIFYGKNKNV